MLENSTFKDEFNKLQESFWDNVECNKKNIAPVPLAPLFEQWLTDVDTCWQDHPKATSGEIDSLYKKLSSSSRFFFNSSSFIVPNENDESSDSLVSNFLEGLSKISEETIDSLYSDNTDNQDEQTDSTDQKHPEFGFNAIFKLVLINWQQGATCFATQATSHFINPDNVKKLENPEFSAALEKYLIALKEYQRVLFALFTSTAKELFELFETLRSKNHDQTSTTLIINTCLEMLEVNYKALISGAEYSKVYANVINSWMLMLSKSNLTFSEFKQSVKSNTTASTSSEQD